MNHDTGRIQKIYAVVKFVTDSTYSEIPVTWLIENADNPLCWWPPKSANCPQLIANYASPEFNVWECYQVNIIKYCTSLESARKHATDSNYETTDEERLGRGKRHHVPNNRFNSDDEEECQDSQPRKYTKKKRVDSTVVSKPPSCPDNFGLYNKETNDRCNEVAVSQQEKRFGTSTVTSKSLSCFENSGLSYMKQLGYNDGYNEAATSQQEKEDQFFGSVEKWKDIDINDSTPLLPIEQNNVENINVQGNCYECKQLLRIQAASNLILKDIKQRLIRVENIVKGRALNPLDNDDSLIAELLPLATINNINDLESILKTSNEAVTQLKRFLLKIGGNNPRDNIHRTLKKIFTNECAIHCSWKGVRKNFRVDNLQLMLIMRREITSYHTALTESEFDCITAEWFRFGKQRKMREDNKNKENENEAISNV